MNEIASLTPTLGQTKPRLLIVDDQASNIQLLHHILKNECDISMAKSGEQALELCRRLSPDLILLDVIMPGIDGFDVCRKLKREPLTRDLPVIFVTGRDSSQDEALGLELGAVDFITKPFSAPVVLARVRTHLMLKAQSDLLRQLAYIDGLTGIANRRHFDENLKIEWRRSLRTNTPLAVIMIDIDQFKAYNDHYGHQQGDHCLRQVGHIVREQVQRASDLVARYGGEEFVCLLPDTDLAGALLVADRMGEAIVSQALPHEASAVSPVVTISRGVAALFPVADVDPNTLVQTADKALYDAKRSGRNRTQCQTY